MNHGTNAIVSTDGRLFSTTDGSLLPAQGSQPSLFSVLSRDGSYRLTIGSAQDGVGLIQIEIRSETGDAVSKTSIELPANLKLCTPFTGISWSAR